ncbi:MAG TPA: hypothetical protein VJ044_10345 [Candidatus Hodarchaeales archaeon]|nr:hypothetical protein [Candidatus Hodarchaeales archaeon]
MAVKKQKTFTVQFDLKLVTTLDLRADSLEEAIAKAREYGVKDLVEFESDYIDGEVEVTGVFG